MNKPTEIRTEPYEYPKGSHHVWTGCGPFGAAALKSMHSPTVLVEKADAPVTFEGSFDGKTFAVIRDKDNEVVRVTKAGVYRLPVAVVWLRPVCDGDVQISTFVQVR